VDLVWVKGEHHGGSNKKYIDVAYIPYAYVQDFLEGEWRELCTTMEWTSTRTCLHKKMSSKLQIHDLEQNEDA